MESIKRKKIRLRNEITEDIEETVYTVIFEEPDIEIPNLVWLYLKSEYEDENVECEVKIINGQPTEIRYAKLSNNVDPLLV